MLGQIVVRNPLSPNPNIDFLENPRSKPSISFQKSLEDVYIPRLGSQDLVRVAAFAILQGWEVDRFELEDDVTENALEGSASDQISEELIDHLVHDSWTRVVEDLIERFPTFSIVGVELVRQDDLALTLRRNGVVDVEEGISPVELISSAWRQLKIA